jgi:hypothetical protein
VESFTEKLGMNTPHFYQSRLMSIFSSCAEALAYVTEYRTNEHHASYIVSAIDEIDSCWAKDSIAKNLFATMDWARQFVFRKIRGGDLSAFQLHRLTVICNSILGLAVPGNIE